MVPVSEARIGIIGGSGLYEMEGVTEEVAREALRLASAKLPVRTAFAIRTVL